MRMTKFINPHDFLPDKAKDFTNKQFNFYPFSSNLLLECTYLIEIYKLCIVGVGTFLLLI